MKQYKKHKIKVPRFSEDAGFYTTRKRSKNMSKIRANNTKAEVKLRKVLWSLGYRYRKNVKKLPGSPDIVFIKYKLAVFVDGEFWHGYNWKQKRNEIKSNREFWIPKIERNMQRDWENNRNLIAMGWIVMRFWQKQVENDFITCLNQITQFIDEKKAAPK